jgi:hypothetical protein
VFLLLSLNVNNLGKAVLHFAFTPFCSWGRAKLSLQIIEHNCAYVKFSLASYNLLPTVSVEYFHIPESEKPS